VQARKAYRPDEPGPVYHHHITIDGKLLSRNQLATLERGIGYPAGKYAFQYAEERPDGQWMLMFFGPVRRSKQRYREVWRNGAAVRTVHRPSDRPDACRFGQDSCVEPGHR
jgi:hypothetical protein